MNAHRPAPVGAVINSEDFQPDPDDLIRTVDDEHRGICFCPASYHAPYCRIGVLLARMERPRDLFRITNMS